MTSKEIVFEGIDLSVGYNSNGEITDVCVCVSQKSTKDSRITRTICSPDVYALLDNNVADRISEQFYKEMEDENNDKG